MPTYEFRCPKGHDFEKFYRSIAAAPIEVACPSCGEIAERQLSAGGGLLFKGSGFYITDYGKDGKKQPAAPAATEGSKSAPETAPAAGAGDAKGSSESKSGTAAKPAPDAKPATPAAPTRKSTSSE